MEHDWGNLENAALHSHDIYVQQLIDEFRYLSEKKEQKDAEASHSSVGDETF